MILNRISALLRRNILYITLNFSILIIIYSSFGMFPLSINAILKGLGTLGFVVSFTIMLYRFLGTPKSAASSDSGRIVKILDALNGINEELVEVRETVGKHSPTSKVENEWVLTESDKKDMADKVAVSIIQGLPDEFYGEIKKTVEYLITDLRTDYKEHVMGDFDEGISRLEEELERLNNRANLNLAIGSGITILALLILGAFVMTENFNSPDMKVALLHFIPRLSLVIFIEFFSFFFLKLYRTTLNEIKYYQNELTNLQMKMVALSATISYGGGDQVALIARELVNVERNFKLSKDESTVELEKTKHEAESLKELLKATLGVLGKKEK